MTHVYLTVGKAVDNCAQLFCVVVYLIIGHTDINQVADSRVIKIHCITGQGHGVSCIPQTYANSGGTVGTHLLH